MCPSRSILESQKRKKREISTISIIIPLYNEENSIKEVLERIPKKLSFEIIVVDDGSTDGSIERIKEMNLKNVRLFRHKRNRGYGAAILTGIKKAKGDIIVTLDSDGQHDPNEISRLIQPLLSNEADMVIGSRYLGNCHYIVPFYTRMGEFFINSFLYLFFGQYVKNNQSGFRAFFKKDIYAPQNISFSNYGYCTELLFISASEGLKIKEKPINLRPRKHGKSNVNLFKILIVITACLLKYGLKRLNLLKIVPQFMKKMFLQVSRS